MQAKKAICILCLFFLFSGLTCSVDAFSDETVSFHSGGVTIDLIYPEEAKPNATTTHNITITSSTVVTLHNFTVVIKAPVNATWQVVFADKLPANFLLQANTPFEWHIETNELPEETEGRLSCFMNVSTSQSAYYTTYSFFTTYVSIPTVSEMRSLYYEMLANYTALQADYEAKLTEYEGLLANYSSLFANYTVLLNQYNALSANSNAQTATYQALLDNYNQLSSEYDTLIAEYSSKTSEYSTLQSDYKDLNSTHNDLQANYNRLQTDYDQLNQTYTELLSDNSELQKSSSDLESAINNDRIVMFIFVIALVALIAFIIYLKQEKEKPYLVIRKETVNMKKEGS